LPGWLIGDLMGTLNELPVEFSVAHMGLYPAAGWPQAAGFPGIPAACPDGSKRCWIKLTGIYRFSQDPAFTDVKPFAEALIARVPTS